MIARWHTGHSLGAGVLGGLLLASHTVTLISVAFAAGVAVGLAWFSVRRVLGRAGRWAGGRLLRPAADSALRDWEHRRRDPW